MKTFELDENGLSITCLVCGTRSWSLQDVAHRYCGNCHQYHSVLERQRAWDQAIVKKRTSLVGRLRAYFGLRV